MRESTANVKERGERSALAGSVVRGGAWSIGGQGATALASLVATPFVIRALGSEFYGLLALINALIGYMAFGDLGMAPASSKLGAAARAEGDDDAEAAVVWTSLLLAALPSLALALALAAGARTISVDVLRLSPAVVDEAVTALRVVSLGFVARSFAGVVNTPQVVRMRWNLYAKITYGGTTAQTLLVPVVLAFGGGFVAAVSVGTVVSILTLIAHAVVSSNLQPRLWPPRLRRAMVRPLLGFGTAMLASHMTLIVLQTVDRPVLARVASLEEVGYYAVAASAAALLNVIPFAVGQPLFPAFTLLGARGDDEETGRLFSRSVLFMVLVITPTVAVLFGAARPFFGVWAGEEFARESVIPFYLLLAGCAFNAVAAVPGALLMARNRVRLLALYHLFELVPYLCLLGLLSSRWGGDGAAAAWALRSAANALLYFHGAHRTLSGKPRLHESVYHRWSISALVLLAPVLAALFRSASTVALAAVSSSLLAYAVLVWRFVLPAEERRMTSAIMAKVMETAPAVGVRRWSRTARSGSEGRQDPPDERGREHR